MLIPFLTFIFGGGVPEPPSGDHLLLGDGTSHMLLGDGTSHFLLG